MWYALYVAMMLGFLIAFSVGALMLAGFWIDERLQTSPLMLILGAVLGLVVAFYNSLSLLDPFINRSKND